MKKIKQLLLKILGEQRYLFFLARNFQWLLKTGKLGSEYQDIYFLKKFIGQGDNCIDIGAHLGYYTFELSRLVANHGKVIAIEPVGKFHHVLQKLISRNKNQNILLEKVALGGDGEFVEIGIPKINNQKKFGYARIKKMHEYLEYAESEMVPNKNGDELFSNMHQIDFIKCDVEGAEVPVFRSLTQTIAKHQPVFLCELADKNERIKMFDMFQSLGYGVYLLKEKKLHLIDVHSDEKAISHNHYFIPSSKLCRFKGLITQ